MKKHITLLLLSMVLLAGCSTQASRMADCQAQGVSKDACYIVEQNRQAGIQNAAEIQALHNAAAQYGQSAKKSHKWGTHIASINKSMWCKLTRKMVLFGGDPFMGSDKA